MLKPDERIILLNNKLSTRNKVLLNISLFYAMFLFGINFAMVGPILIEVSKHIDTRLEVMGYYFSFVSTGFIIGSFVSSFFVRLKKRKIIFIIFYLLLPASILLLAYAKNFPILLVSAFFIGISNGLLETNVTVLLAELYRGRESLILNTSQAFIGFGSFVSPILITFLLSNGSNMKTAFLIIVVFSLVNFVLLMFTKIPDTHLNIPAADCTPSGREAKGGKRFSGIKPVFKINFLLLAAVFAAMFFYVCMESGINSWMPTFLRLNKNFTPVFAGNALAFFWLTVAVGRLALGWLSTKVKISYLLLAVSILIAITFKLSTVFNNHTLIIILFIMTGLLLSGIWPMIVAQSVNFYPEKSKLIVPLIIMTGGIGAIFSPWVVGIVYDNYNLASGVGTLFIFAVVMAVFVAGSVCLELISKRHKS